MFVPPDRMGAYDRTPVMYDPRGRILQILYARRAVSQGTPSCGILFKDGVVLAGRRKISVLLMPNKKVFQIDDNILATFAGYSSDGMFLIELARDKAASLKFVYGSDKPDIYVIARYISSIMHQATLYAGLRPFGVSLIIGGIDLSGAKLFFSDPGGSTVAWKAGIIGRNSKTGEKFLEELFKDKNSDSLTFEDAAKYALAAIMISSGEIPSPDEIEIGYIIKDKQAKITTASDSEIYQYYEEAKKIYDEWKSKLGAEEKEETEGEE